MTLASILALIFNIMVLVFITFSIVIVYHWFTYGHDKKASMLSLAIFLLLSMPPFLAMAIALTQM